MIRSFRSKHTHVTGLAPRTLLTSLQHAARYMRDMRTYRRLNQRPSMQVNFADIFPILTDMEAAAGVAGGHYFFQDMWAARKIYQRRPERHIDIGSRIDGFIAHLLVFMPVTVVDIRPMTSSIAGLTFFQDDASELSHVATGSIDSISTLHAAEHFGLGRYTDPVDPEGCFKFMTALERVLAPGGRLYFSVPVGRERVEFNAHRVFAPRTILEQFSGLQLLSFSYVGDDGDLHEDNDPMKMPESELGCGLFEFTKAVAS